MTKARDLSVVPNQSLAFKNRIINGAMQIDQRNAGASVSSHLAFPVDRFQVIKDTPAGTFTAQQSSVAPTGFVNSLLFTVGTAYTPSTSQNNFIKQIIEGFNVADLGWGTANAQTVTMSFWVRSSLTGTFGASLRNGASNRSYPFSYAISASNTWEYKTVTIPGDTTGTWLTTNGNGIEISWGLSVGSTFSNTAGSWYAGNFISTTGAVMLTSTAGATWQITGVQLEVGSNATSFDYRPYGTELALCQRYYQRIGGGQYVGIGMGINNGGVNTVACQINYVVAMRASPTTSISGSLIATNRISYDAAVTSIGEVRTGLQSAQLQFTHNNAGTDRFPEQIAVAGGQTGFINLDSEL